MPASPCLIRAHVGESMPVSIATVLSIEPTLSAHLANACGKLLIVGRIDRSISIRGRRPLRSKTSNMQAPTSHLRSVLRQARIKFFLIYIETIAKVSERTSRHKIGRDHDGQPQ